jgi:hypothetical protein
VSHCAVFFEGGFDKSIRFKLLSISQNGRSVTMIELRIALEKVRLLAALLFAAGATCVLVPGTSAAFNVGSLTGGYGCLGQATPEFIGAAQASFRQVQFPR